MSSKLLHVRQVKVENKTLYKFGDNHATATNICWIPGNLGKVGKKLGILNKKTNEWEYGWVVTEVYGTEKYEEVLEDSNDYKTQREASDSYDNQGPVATAFMKG